ncbi:MAG: bifunctional demethylmenaquinone methyltransferase/2-methoxy-6-polyprenyl-1,4-benzoquinol methylase [Gammaproteobacteria bacterium]|nr:MAG: bifunctional demethylmenaquinone methyltransferase/2-methoxy-6-polyprenyl-1,4-benzoquinol methylase [Gammaproteobacteria bacterium]
MKHRLSSTFGQNSVSPEEREKLVRSVFNRVAGRYDLMNDLMSMGVHRFWKWLFCREVNKTKGQATAEQVFVDLAGGTGDIAKALIDGHRKVLLLDPSEEMMSVAEKRLGNSCSYITAAAEDIPLEDESVDVLTISFGIRNTTDIAKSLQEITRVLKPGGHFYCLEFSRPYAWLRPFYDAWSRIVIPRLGAAVAGHPDAYTYLVESIREFPAQEEMAEMIRTAGLVNVSYSNMTFGIACIHRGEKLQ